MMSQESENTIPPAQFEESSLGAMDPLIGIKDVGLVDLLKRIDASIPEIEEGMRITEFRDSLAPLVDLNYVVIWKAYTAFQERDVMDFGVQYRGKARYTNLKRNEALLFSTAIYLLSNEYGRVPKLPTGALMGVVPLMREALGESLLQGHLRDPLTNDEMKARVQARKEGRVVGKTAKPTPIGIEANEGPDSDHLTPSQPDVMDQSENPKSKNQRNDSEPDGAVLGVGEDFVIPESFFVPAPEVLSSDYLSREIEYMYKAGRSALSFEQQNNILAIGRGMGKVTDNMNSLQALIRASSAVVNLFDKYPKFQNVDELFAAVVEISRKKKSKGG